MSEDRSWFESLRSDSQVASNRESVQLLRHEQLSTTSETRSQVNNSKLATQLLVSDVVGNSCGQSDFESTYVETSSEEARRLRDD